MKKRIQISTVILAASIALIGCGKQIAKIQTQQTTDGKWSPPVESITMDDLKGLTGMQPTNGTLQEIVVWTNAAGDKSLGITRDGGIWFKVKF
jgi:hypothetical protein